MKIPCAAFAILMGASAPLLAAMEAAEDAALNLDEWKLTSDLTWVSRYVPDGFSVGGDHPAWQPSVLIDTPLPGFSIKFWGCIQAERAQKASDEYDLILSYAHDFCQDSPFAITVDAAIYYFVFPNSSITEDRDGNAISPHDLMGVKFWAGFALPKLIPLGDSFLIPSYHYSYWIPLDGELFEPGGMHTLRLDYSHSLPVFIPGVKSQSVFIGGIMNYHDGFFGVAPGWSHTIMRAGTAVGITDDLSASISFNYQWSFTDSVNPEDVYWYTASITYQF